MCSEDYVQTGQLDEHDSGTIESRHLRAGLLQLQLTESRRSVEFLIGHHPVSQKLADLNAFTIKAQLRSEMTVNFDKLCKPCADLFNAEANWVQEYRRLHHNIYALTNSSEAGCHLCSLVLGQLTSDDVINLRRDINDSTVAPSQQISIRVSSDSTLKIFARSKSICRDPWWTDDHGWTRIARLDISESGQENTDHARSKEPSNYSESTRRLIAHWMRECTTSHTKCFDIQTRTATQDVLPGRLLDLASVEQNGLVRLVSAQLLPVKTIYVTLSHCWGGQSEKTLTTNTLQIFQYGIPLNSLPITFRDAAIVTSSLGVRYLWIDALCIIQDSKDDTDWRREASIMGDIYANSHVTLGASTASNSQGGLLHHRDPLSVWPCRLTPTWTVGTEGKLVISRPGWGGDAEMKPLASRAWAYQERLLSKRMLHFSGDQVRWECFSLAASEVNPGGVHRDIYGAPVKRAIVHIWGENEAPMALWDRIRHDYSDTALTFATDRLIAFSGIARMVQKIFGFSKDDYLAGLWRPTLLEELLWLKVEGEGMTPAFSGYIAPTWSWASVSGPVRLVTRLSGREIQGHANIIDARTSPIDDAFGPVKDGSITLQCTLCRLSISSGPRESVENESNWTISTINGVSVTHESVVSLDHALPAQSASSTTLLSFYCTPILSTRDEVIQHGNVAGLLLSMTGKRRGQYYRSGLFRINQDDAHPSGAVSYFDEPADLDSEHYLSTMPDGPCYIVEIV